MPSNKINNLANNLAYVGDEDRPTRKFIRNRNYAKKDDKLTKDKKSHKKEHREHVSRRFQARIAKGVPKPEQFRIPEPKKPKAKAVIKGQPKRKAYENWKDQWEDTVMGQTFDLEESYDEVKRDEDNCYRALEMPKEIEEFELLQYKDAQEELDQIMGSAALYYQRKGWEIQDKITSYENKQRLKELKAGLTMTVSEYEEQKRELNRIWIVYKAHRIPRHLFDGSRAYEENKLRLEICELEPVLNEKLWRELKTKIQEWEEYFDQYYAKQNAEMEEYFAQKEAEIEEYQLLQMIENSESLQNFVSRLQKD